MSHARVPHSRGGSLGRSQKNGVHAWVVHVFIESFLTFVCILGQTQERGWSFSCPCLASYARHRLLNVVLPEANGNRQLWHVMDIFILGLGAALQCGSWKQRNATAVVCCHCLKTSKTFHFCNKTHTCTCIFSKSCNCHFEKLQLQFLVVSCRVAVQRSDPGSANVVDTLPPFVALFCASRL